MIKFGPSGNSESFYAAGFAHTEQSAAFVKAKGLDCFEYSFGRGVRMTEDKAKAIGRAFAEAGIEISAHAPYFINFANPDEEMVQKSYGYVLDTAKALKAMGGKRVVFHPAAQGKLAREEAVALTEKRLKILAELIEENGLGDMLFCPETMGKLAQIGTVEEITRFCKLAPFYIPCVDFGHINAREQGSLRGIEDYESRLQYMLGELGMEKMRSFHVHFSKIQYSAKGEVRHLTFEDDVYGPEFPPLALTLKKYSLEPYIVSESAGTQTEDAQFMKKVYFGE